MATAGNGIVDNFETGNLSKSSITIHRESPDTPDSRVLIAELDNILKPLSPPETQYGYSVERLIKEGVAFFVLCYDDIPAGCGGVKCFGREYAEVKRMYVRPAFRGLGLSKMILSHLEEYTASQGIQTIRLETGALQKEAIGLYEGMGFHKIPAFGDYNESPYNIFYEKRLTVIDGA